MFQTASHAAATEGEEDRHTLQVLFESTASECRRIVESLSLLREYVWSIQEVGRVDSESLSRLVHISASLQSACFHVPPISQSTQPLQLRPNVPLESATLLDEDEMPPLEPPMVRPLCLESTATAPHLHHPQESEEILTQERAKGKTFKKQQVVGRRY